jgi:hypothetical protein
MEHKSLRLVLGDVAKIANEFLAANTGYTRPHIESITQFSETTWQVVVDVGTNNVNLKDVIVNDRDGNVISYKDHRSA